MKKHYAIYNPETCLYSLGLASSIQSWGSIDQARLFEDIGPTKSHINRCRKMAAQFKRDNPYPNGIQIVEITIQRVVSNILETA